MTTITIQYDIRDEAEEVAKLLCIPQELTYLNLEVDYHIITGFTGSYYDAPEPPEVEFETDPVICSVETTTGSFIPSANQIRYILMDLLSYERIEELCWTDHEKELDDWIVDKADRVMMDKEDWGRL